MLRLLLAALLLCCLSAGTLVRGESVCADDGCGCPHEAPSLSCCCDGERAEPARAPALGREELLDELREGLRSSGPCVRSGGCRRAPRPRASVPGGAQPGLDSTRSASARAALSTAPRARTARPPEELELEPSIPPPRGHLER